jgi:hypothetical protein
LHHHLNSYRVSHNNLAIFGSWATVAPRLSAVPTAANRTCVLM